MAHQERVGQRREGQFAVPELEVFDSGHVRLANHFVESGIIEGTPLYQLCLGISWGQPATPAAMAYMRDLLPPGASIFQWSGSGSGGRNKPED